MDFRITGGNANAKIEILNKKEKDGILTFDVKMTLPEKAIPERFSIEWSFPICDCYSVWSPAISGSRDLRPDWGKQRTNSRLAGWMPLHQIVSVNGRNRMAIAISDAVTPTAILTGVCEETAELSCIVEFFSNLVAPLEEYRATVRIDLRDIPYYDSLYAVTEWWEKECGYTPAFVPEHARLPMNSLWYSYHQRLIPDEIIRECRLSKELGMDTVIIDDGWQTDDNNRGYAFCGDWEVAESKIPDMKKFVEDIHATGMKIIIWYSVSFMGSKSNNYDRFKDMLLGDTRFNGAFDVLDPRYKEVRDFLVGTYVKAVTDWNLDGLKLDFIDTFRLINPNEKDDPRRDTSSVEEATDILMTEITKALTAVKPDIMIEFRQTYVGPAIRKYGNMLRVGDCPNDAIVNRREIVNLRFTSGKTAIHSDMLMWNINDPVETAAQQLASVLYAVPQVSVKLETLPEEHKRMVKYYLGFWRENRDVLLDGKILAANPESQYSLVCAEKDGKAIFTAYTDSVVDLGDYSETVTVNCTRYDSLVIKNADGKSYRVVNCMGEELETGTIAASLAEISVPLSGMIFVK